MRERQEAQAWTQTDELLATLVEVVHALYAVTVQANSSKRVNIEPLHIPRPHEGPRKPVAEVSHASMNDFRMGR